MMNKIYTVDEIKSIVIPIAKRHGIAKVFLFGSYARGAANDNSDIDLCIETPDVRGMFALGSLYADLEDALNKNLDLVTENSLRYNEDARFVDNLRRDRILIYEQLQ